MPLRRLAQICERSCRAHQPQFLGYNNIFEGEKNTHVDYIEWHKGRETEFSASTGFLFKISGGDPAS